MPQVAVVLELGAPGLHQDGAVDPVPIHQAEKLFGRPPRARLDALPDLARKLGGGAGEYVNVRVYDHGGLLRFPTGTAGGAPAW